MLEGPAGIYGDLDVEKFNSDYAAVVEGKDQRPGLLISTLPLRDEGEEGEKEPVDLDLGFAEGELQPGNPLAEVAIPAEIGEGIFLPEVGIRIEPAGAPDERAVSNLDGSAGFYPNISVDTDLVVAPTPTGIETSTVLRSAEAPRTQRFELTVPSGARLDETPDGGAEVTRDDDTLLVVRPPTAIDAEGDPVPVTLGVEDNSLLLQASPGEGDAFPILVDPIYETYSWLNTNTNTGIYTDWRAGSTNEALLKPSWIGVWNQTMHAGLNIRSYLGAITPYSSATWNYYVPRYFSDYTALQVRPTSFIRSMNLSQLYFLIEEGQPVHAHPILYVLIWSDAKQEFVTLGSHSSAEGQYNGVTVNLPNPQEITDAKSGGISLATAESISYPRQAFVGQATVELSDKDSPGFGSLGSASGWLHDQPTSPINYVVSDPGLGVHQLQVQQPGAAGGRTQVITSANCVGTASNPCPRTLKTADRSLSYAPATMPQGENWVQVTATDPIGQKSAVGEARVNVDHTAPTLALSGTLAEQATVGTKLPQYTLNMSAADGDDDAAAAQAPFGTAGSGPGQFKRPMGVAIDVPGNIWVVDRENNRVQKYDATGNFLSQFGETGTGSGKLSEPRGIAITPAGNIWVSEVGNKRLQLFKPNGELIRQITNTAIIGAFKEPYGLATGPGETLWVTDTGSHYLYRYTESGTLLQTIGSGVGGSPPDLTTPVDVDVDAFGNAWVTETWKNKVLEFGPTGNFLFSFGTEGSGPGQIKWPSGIEITASGHILVVDAGNNRVEEFMPDGTYMRQFGSTGSGNAQLSEPRGIALGAGNTAVIADHANKRIARWSHVDLDEQSGVRKVEVKVDGISEWVKTLECDTGSCSVPALNLNADAYPVGQHQVEVIATDGVQLVDTKKLTIETHGDRKAPGIALSGSMTEQASLGTTRPSYRIKADATDPGSSEERQSGVASLKIKVDGKVVSESAPGCPAGGCSLSREWTLESDEYQVGSHSVEVTATDSSLPTARSTTKTLTVNIARDETPPQITATGPLIEAPEGWVQQKTFSLPTTATDTNGYGVKQIFLKIDGKLVSQAWSLCELGGCSKTRTFSLNTANYEGGAHEAELIAVDWAENTATKAWTMNVDPSGAISTSEAEGTLEALDDTSQANTVGEAESEPEYEGTREGLEFETAAGDLQAVGSEAPTSVDADSTGEISIKVPVPESFTSCPNDSGEGTAQELSGIAEEELAEAVTCNEESDGIAPEAPLVSVGIIPIEGTSGSHDLNASGSASINTNASDGVDLIVRPLFDGAMTFAAIRDPAGPESFSWQVELEPDQELQQIDSQHAQVTWLGGVPAFSIAAVPAHDAIGTSVPTSLQVSGNTVTLTVGHRAGSYIYPVVGGAGWEGGFQTYVVDMPAGDEEEEIEEGELDIEQGLFTERTFGPPVFLSSDNDIPIRRRAYNFNQCHWGYSGVDSPDGKPSAPLPPKQRLEEEVKYGCHGTKGGGTITILWAISVSGTYKYKRGQWAQDANGPDCRKWGPYKPALIHCRSSTNLPAYPHLDVIGAYRFRPGYYAGGVHSPGQAECFELNGVLPSWKKEEYPGEKVLSGNLHWSRLPVPTDDPCPWGHLRQEV